jgi:predicted AlkP superfamily pyrophosphatase or phosphodiesterase
MTTGRQPAEHGIVANGVATFRSAADQALVDASNFADYRRQISFWEQSNQFLQSPRFWQDQSGRSRWKTALLFFQHSMPGFGGARRAAADIVLTPKPDHGSDGKLVNLCWSQPAELVPRLFAELGPFPLMNYWGPMAGIASSQWIAKSAAIVWREHSPQLEWVYIPHLDYDMQRFGPDSPQAGQAVRDAATALEPLVAAVLDHGGKIILLSEYALSRVEESVQPNRILRDAGLLMTRQTADGALIDYERSAALAMVDHQIAHIYARDPAAIAQAREALEARGIAASEPTAGLRHRRCGDLVLTAQPNLWFDYRWWSDAAEAPVFAKMVDIHRKPGYDPLELFWDRATNGISQNSALVHGSHGRVTEGQGIFLAEEGPVGPTIEAADVASVITRSISIE